MLNYLKKENDKKKTLLYLAVGIWAFSSCSLALAFDYSFSQTVGGGFEVFGFNNTGYSNLLAQSITPTSTMALQNVHFKIQRDSTNTNDTIFAELRSNSSTIPSNTVLASSSLVSYTGISTSTLTDVTFSFPTSYQMTGGQTYWVILNRSNPVAGGGLQGRFLTSQNNTGVEYYSGGRPSIFIVSSTNYWYNEDVKNDLVFTVNADFPNNYVALDFPTSTYSGFDFQDFFIEYKTNSTAPQVFASVQYWNTTTSSTVLRSDYFVAPTSTISYITIAKDLLPVGSYQAKVYLYERVYSDLYNYNDTQIAESGVTNFTITNPLIFNGYISLPTSTASTSASYITCDPNSGFFASSICNVLVWAFVPSTDVVARYTNLANTIIKKPPMGYFSLASNALNNFTNINSTSTNLFPDTSTMANPFFSMIKTGLTWLLWVLFGFAVFSRLRHLNL